MYCKSMALFATLFCAVIALPQHDSHSGRAHSIVHPVHGGQHHDAHHSGHHEPAVSSQSLFIHHSAGHQAGGQAAGGQAAGGQAAGGQAAGGQAVGGHAAGGQTDGGHHGHEEEHHGHPKYVFEYKVEDPHTGDNKYQKESRDGDKVEGVYHFVEADGRLRTVKYHVDKHSGFNAEVIHSGHAVHVEQPKHQHH